MCLYSVITSHKKNSFHKLIHVLQIFIRKIFMIQCHPQNIVNMELFPNYGDYHDHDHDNYYFLYQYIATCVHMDKTNGQTVTLVHLLMFVVESIS